MKLSLPNVNFFKSKEKKEFFLSLQFAPNKIGAILFENINGTLQVITSFEEDEKDTDKLTTEELISAADRVITSVEQSLPKGSELRKTIFAVPYTWQEETKIDRQHLLMLKKMCEELDLVPLGFLVGVEAMIHFLKAKEGAPVTAIFIELYTDRVFAFLVKNNNLVEVKHAPIEESVVSTVDKLLKNSTAFEVLPARIFLQNERKSEKVQQEFLSHDWSADLPFIHEPQVIVFEKGFENEAIINGVANQMGIELTETTSQISEAEKVAREDFVASEHALDSGSPEELEDVSEEFGFYKEKDVQFEEIKKPRDEITEGITDAEPDASAQDFDSEDEVFEEEKEPSFVSGILGSILGLKNLVKSIPLFSLPAKLANAGGKGFVMRIGMILIPVVIIIAGFLYVYYAYILKAQVVVFLDKKMVNQNVNVTFSSTDPTSADNNTVHINTSTHDESENSKINTTGQKETGDKAKGTVTLYNKTDSQATYDKGTVLVGPNNLEFETLSDVSIASTSSFATSFSSKDVDVVASAFGTDYNLASGSNFTVKSVSSSDVFGKNSSAFSGGTKKEIQVVAAKDITSLSDQVQKELEKKAVDALTANGDSIPLPVALSSDFTQKNFDHKEGDEAKTLSLSANMTVKTGSYNKSEIQNFVKNLAKGDIPSNYQYLESESHIDIGNVHNNKGVVSGTLKVNAVFLPRIDQASIKQAIAKKSETDAKNYLKQTNIIQDATIIFIHKIPFLPVFIPANSKNIELNVKANG